MDNAVLTSILERLDKIADNTADMRERIATLEANNGDIPDRVEALEAKRHWLAGVWAAVCAAIAFGPTIYNHLKH